MKIFILHVRRLIKGLKICHKTIFKKCVDFFLSYCLLSYSRSNFILSLVMYVCVCVCMAVQKCLKIMEFVSLYMWQGYT